MDDGLVWASCRCPKCARKFAALVTREEKAAARGYVPDICEVCENEDKQDGERAAADKA